MEDSISRLIAVQAAVMRRIMSPEVVGASNFTFSSKKEI
jgi:hypothetical protein